MSCWKNKNGCCVLQDDMGQFYPMLEEADVLVFASPVYWFNLGGQIKQFIDRCYALAGMELPDGVSFFSQKKIGLVLAHEGDDPFDSGGINAIRSIQDTCSYVGATFAGLELPDGKSFFSHKKIGLVIAHEGDDQFDSVGINAIRSIQDTCSYVGATFAGALYGCANDEGEAANNPALLKKAKEFGAAL
jgi:multimeric flavodoxin WrbA